MLGILKPKLFVVIASISGLASALATQAASQQALVERVALQPTISVENKNPRVFISNVGSDADRIVGQGGSVSGGPRQAYNKFYAAVQSSGQYQLVSSPTEADFVFQIRYTNPHEVVRERVEDDPDPLQKYPPFPPKEKIVDRIVFHPQVRLVIFDPRTHAVYGTFTERFEIEHTQQERDAAFADAIRRLLGGAGNLLGHFSWSITVPAFVRDPPAPSQIASAKTVFVSNSIPSVRAYNILYAMMEKWGGYLLSPVTTGADLILQLSNDPELRMAVVDPKTGVILWGFTPDVGEAILKRNAHKDQDRVLAAIVQDIARLSGRPARAGVTSQDMKDAAAPPEAPIPPQLSSAKTVFISNAGGEPLSDWKHRPLQPYNAFYATMKNWARFRLVDTPAEADLVFQISVVRSEPLVLRLTILDSKTHAALRTFDQDIRGDQTIGGSFAEQKDLDKTIAALVTRVAKVTGQPDAHLSVPQDAPAVPPPSRVIDLRRVFVSRPWKEDEFFETNAPDQIYATLDAGLRTWGRYQLTPPSEADLIFEPSVSDSSLPMGAAVSSGSGSIAVQSAWGSRVCLTIRDAKTRHILWTFVRPVRMTVINDDVLSNYRDVVGLLLGDLRQLTALTPQDRAKTAAPR